MVETVSTDTADQALSVRILPWRSWHRDDFFNVYALDTLAKVRAVDRVTVSKQEPRHLIKRKGFDDMRGRPACGWIRRYVEVDNHTAVVSKYDEAEQYAEGCGWKRKEIIGHNVFGVIVQGGLPCLRRKFPRANFVLVDGCRGDDVSNQGKFRLNARRSPQRILARHALNQLADFLIDLRSTGIPGSGLPSPIKLDANGRPFPVGR